MYIPKVAASAQLMDITGTQAQRRAFALDKTLAVACKIQDSFQRNEPVTIEKLHDFLTPHAKGVNIEMVDLEEEKNLINDPNKISEHCTNGNNFNATLHFLLFPPALQPEHFLHYTNTIAHFFNNITSPKITARKEIRLLELQTLGRAMKGKGNYLEFRTFAGEFRIDGGIIADPKKYFEALKKGLEKSSKATNLTASEKIDYLQCWRHELIDEKDAATATVRTNLYVSGLNDTPEQAAPTSSCRSVIPHSREKTIGEKSLDKATEATMQKLNDSGLYFNEKLQLLGDCIKKEIETHRNEKKLKPQKASIPFWKNLLQIGN